MPRSVFTHVEHLVVIRVSTLLIASAICFATSGWFYYDSLHPRLCTIDSPKRTLELTAGQEQHSVTFTFTNSTNDIVRIVGLADC